MDNKKANRLCTISLALGILGAIVLPVIIASKGALFAVNSNSPYIMQELVKTANLIPIFISGCCTIAALALMIVVRAKYPRNTFAKVLMWIYIAVMILYVILIMAAIIGFFWLLSQMLP